jgi:hypothetical protein
MRWPFARGAERRLDEAFAWACLVANLAGMPGVGSLMAGRLDGFPQAVLALAGGVLLTYWLWWFMAAVLRASAIPTGGAHLGIALAGIGLFGASWLWSLVSSLAILRQARRAETRH